MSWLERLKSQFMEPGGPGGRLKFNHKLLLLLVLGVGLIIFNSLFTAGRGEPAAEEHAPPAGGEQPANDIQLRELTAMLNQIGGVNNAAVFITLEDSGRVELVRDEEESRRETVETDTGGGTREITEITSRQTHVILRDASGREIPLVTRESRPLYRGVLVVADGVEDPAVKARVVEALHSVLGLPYHRITVLPRGS